MSSKEQLENKGLKRSMGIGAATSVGVGTMVGAGIFVFPGIAGAQAGAAAILSFAIGGLIALLVALCTSELATAMPSSGGAYVFVSRSFGSLWGALIGISQWLGLVFAAAFYIMGFSDYFKRFLSNIGYDGTTDTILIALIPVLVLFFLNVVGTKKVGSFQNAMVTLLAVLLFAVFFYGLFEVLGFFGQKNLYREFAPKGLEPIFSTTGLIFTSYLGFVQIATIGGDIKNPRKNLPIALLSSVGIVLIMYILVVFVTTAVLTVEELRQYGQLAIAEVARKLLGDNGPIFVIIAGLLATLSSANASIISASRSVYALAKNELIPKKLARLNKRFKTPHYALLFAVLPIVAMLFLEDLELFAEVASFLHLVIYVAVCASLLYFTKCKRDDYQPSFTIPLRRVIPVLAIAGCLLVAMSMNRMSIIIGVVICAIALVYYFFFKRS
ncbi:APC family permease [uncultured Winogradskyella sp.]|uniref:APC family permease n=1 Tax=uncultured Winogradskyella sp. TaxID=395353 RepID=UPI003518AA10